jgi:formate dehydrogenase maturation protein FdhE
MDIASRIRKHGFRRWYERQLIDCHLALVTCLLAGLVAVACLEAMDFSAFGGSQMTMLAIIFGALVLCWFSWRRYITILERAETYGSRSTCPECGTYGRFEVIATGHVAEGPYHDPPSDPLPHPWLRVRCRVCQAMWRIPE